MGSAKRNQSVGRVWPGVGGKAAIATASPKKICVTQKPAKIGQVIKTTWHFRPEDLVKIKFIKIDCKKSMGQAF
jgi:hypothetical protein